MPLPDPFSDVEQIQALIRQTINREIRAHFSDLGGDDWDPDVTTTRGQMRYCLTHKDDDTLQLTLLRMFLYYFTYGQAKALQTPVYGIPVPSYQESVVHLPQVKLFFVETYRNDFRIIPPVTAEITFRLIGESSESMTEAKAEILANKIKTLFAGAQRFTWNKGREIATYRDKQRGYDFKLYVRDETEARRVIEQILDIQGHTPEWENLSISVSKRNFTNTAPTGRVYGKTRRLPRRRPVAEVKFSLAELHIWGLQHPVTLVAPSYFNRRALAYSF